MTDGNPFVVMSKPGVKRDGASGDQEDFHTDAQWCRWHQGRARKMGGFRQIYGSLSEVVRGINIYPLNNFLYLHMGSGSYLTRIIFDSASYNVAGVAARTPSGFAASVNNLWQFDQIYDASASFTAGTTRLIAHAAPNAADISSDTATPVYSGDISATAVLTAIASATVSGGCVCLFPYTFVFGSDGYVRHSVANDPTNMTGVGSNQARVTSKKIVRGMPIRGGASNTPAGLLWSLDSIIRVSYTGGAAIFSYDAMSSQNGILAANSVIEHDGTFYWAGTGRFMMFNGVVRELPNQMNSNYFFENLNWTYRNKVFAFKVARFGELWWCFPKGSSTECDYAIIYNINHQTWYDTPLPNTGRSAAENPSSYRFPFMAGIEAVSGSYLLWQHESGVDEVSGSPLQTRAIRSFYRTHEFNSVVPGNQGFSGGVFEPDFVQTGDMAVTLYNRANVRAEPQATESRTFVAAPTNVAAEQLVGFKQSNRYVSFLIESNVSGGFYQAGKPLFHAQLTGGKMIA